MELAKYIDHTILKADTTEEQVDQIIAEAKEYHFASVMVNPYWIEKAALALRGTDVHACCVIGFPLGANTTSTKVFEAQEAIAHGADEVDMVMNIGELKAGHDAQVLADITAVVTAGHKLGALVKVIIETALLSKDEITRASKLVAQGGANYVKTSTGFSTAGAKVEDVKLMKAAVAGTDTQVKASGGIHTKAEAEAMVAAGATRLGVSSSIAIIKG